MNDLIKRLDMLLAAMPMDPRPRATITEARDALEAAQQQLSELERALANATGNLLYEHLSGSEGATITDKLAEARLTGLREALEAVRPLFSHKDWMPFPGTCDACRVESTLQALIDAATAQPTTPPPAPSPR